MKFAGGKDCHWVEVERGIERCKKGGGDEPVGSNWSEGEASRDGV